MTDPLMAVLMRIAEACERLATAVELLAAPPQQPDAPPEACDHPEDLRISFGETNGQPDWQCGACGYRTVTA